MKRKAILLILFISVLLMTACAQGEEAATDFDRGFTATAEAPAFEAESAVSDDTFSGESFNVNLQGQEGPDRLIIRTGNVSIVVEDSEASAQAIAQLAGDRSGWVVASDLYESGGARRGTVTIKIPAEQFDAVLVDIKDLAKEVRSESTSSQDVTEEFVDLEARLANLEATADRVRAFLDEARNVEEALQVNQELSRLESEIEVIKGRMQYLSQSAAFSTLTVDLIPDELSQPIEIGGWQPEGVAKDAIEALVTALQGLADALIWGGIFCLPLALLVGIPLFFVGRFFYRRRRAKKAGLEADKDATEAAETSSAGDDMSQDSP